MNHDKMMNAIHEIFDPALPRLAPGDDAVTRRALDLLFNGGLGSLPSDFRVLDVGCGNGYYALRMALKNARTVLGLDPTLLFLAQFAAISHFSTPVPVFVLPLRLTLGITALLMLPGIKWNTSAEDFALIESGQLARFDGEKWVLFGEVIGK